MKISIICPTYGRPERHQNLYAAFTHQTYPDKELLVLDDSPEKSPFFQALQDKQVHYQHLSKKQSIGNKRNQLVVMAKGELIVHFDDDDYYAPQYVETMVRFLDKADFAKLCKWLAWKEEAKELWEWDTRSMGNFEVTGRHESVPLDRLKYYSAEKKKAVLEARSWGFGFTYVYRKSLWNELHFDDQDHGEDYVFVQKAQNLGKICLNSPEHPHLVLHRLRSQGSSLIYPQKKLEASDAFKIFGEVIKPWLV